MRSGETVTPEQRTYLDEGNAHRARCYGCELREADLTLALAWWCAWWRDQADRKDVRQLAQRQGQLDMADGTAHKSDSGQGVRGPSGESFAVIPE